MSTPEEYRRQIEDLGLSEYQLGASTITDANERIKEIREFQKQLRVIKRNINQDMKDIRAEIRVKKETAGSGSSAMLTILGSKKAAGQARASAKRQLTYQQESILEPYNNIKITIDDLLHQLDSAKLEFQNLIFKLKEEEKNKKEALEEEAESLRTLHLKTVSPHKPLQIKRQTFNVPPLAIPSSESYPKPEKPKEPLLKEPGLKGRFSKKYRQQVESENLTLMEQFRKALEEWEAVKESRLIALNKAEEEYRETLAEWETAKAKFDDSEQIRIQKISEARLSDKATMEKLLGSYFKTLEWPLKLSIDFTVDVEMVVFDVGFPDIIDWPIETKTEIQKRRDYLTHIHSLAFKIIGAAFVVLPGIKHVIFSGYIWTLNKRTGQPQKEYILSTKVLRSTWEVINFERLDHIDVVESFHEFETRRNFTKTAIIKPIEPIDIHKRSSKY